MEFYDPYIPIFLTMEIKQGEKTLFRKKEILWAFKTESDRSVHHSLSIPSRYFEQDVTLILQTRKRLDETNAHNNRLEIRLSP